MGADQSGKQELPIELVKDNSLFADVPAQSTAIGEFELASQQNPELEITPIGAVLVGGNPGRVSDQAITLFDSSGIALQDLAVAELVLDKALAEGTVTEVVF